MPISNVLEITPHNLRVLVELVKTTSRMAKDMPNMLPVARELEADIKRDQEILSSAKEAIARESRRVSRMKKQAKPDEMDWGDIMGQHDGTSFLHVVNDVFNVFDILMREIIEMSSRLQPVELLLSDDFGTMMTVSPRRLHSIMAEMSINKPAIDRVLHGLSSLDYMPNRVEDAARAIYGLMDHYYQVLIRRHTTEGIEIFNTPLVTDVAIYLFDNIDSHGEIEHGTAPDKLSAYTMAKANVIARTFLENTTVSNLVREDGELMRTIETTLKTVWDGVYRLKGMFQKQIDDYNYISLTPPSFKRAKEHSFMDVLESIKDLDPNSVPYREREEIMTQAERFQLKFRNESLSHIAKMIVAGCRMEELVKYIFERKSELKKYMQEENSFYVCKIGTGNVFSGEAPGSLEVIPSEKPVVKLDEVIGSGFDDIRHFLHQVKVSGKWHDLFLATSPSRTVDKSNVLLVGPQGCGKTEVLRSVGSEADSISIFAQGSDFLTCWAGEAQKNPKRLFEAALKLARQSSRHVHILIDEIDAILNDDRGQGSSYTNLTLEFQILMDGVVNYPNISIWGTTNRPERIPMPMIRRFSKVLVVGKLDNEQRIKLLRHFIGGFLPLSGMKSDEDWAPAAAMLEGSTGDIIRKIADALWREKIAEFTVKDPKAAEETVEWLNADGKFTVADFTPEKRAELKKRIKAQVKVTKVDIERTIESHLGNIAIHNEIETAVETYERTDRFLAAIKKQVSRSDNGKSKKIETEMSEAAREEALKDQALVNTVVSED